MARTRVETAMSGIESGTSVRDTCAVQSRRSYIFVLQPQHDNDATQAAQ